MQDAELCKELLQRILPELEIDHVEYPEAQKSIKTDVDAKSVRLDVYQLFHYRSGCLQRYAAY